MKLLSLLLIFFSFLFLFLHLASAEATDGSQVKTIDAVGNIIAIGGIQEENESLEEEIDFSNDYELDDNSDEAEEDFSESIQAANIDAGKSMIVNAGKELGFWFGDSLREGAFEFESVNVSENVTGSRTPKYTLYSTSINPFSAPNVRTFLIICMAFHIFAALFFLFLGLGVYSAGTIRPKEVAEIRAGLSGEYSQFDIRAYLLVCCCVMFMPLVDAFGIWFSVLVRNGLAAFMSSGMVDMMNMASDNVINNIVYSVTLYTTYLEKGLGEYTVYILTSLLFIKTWIMALILIFGSLKQAAVLHFSIMIGFILVLVMDIQTLFFISSGVILSVWKDWPLLSLAGMIVGGFFDAVILLFIFVIPAVILFSKAKSKLSGAF